MMEKLVGRPAMVRMGIEKGQRSVDLGTEIFLYCHTLEYDREPLSWFPYPGPFTAQCIADDWGGYISFNPSAEANQRLGLLRDGVTEEVTKIEHDFWTHRVVLSLAPFAIFLILSASFSLIRRATAFVMAG